jgi:hypothetical protein
LHHEFTAIHKLTKKKKTDVTVSATLAFARQFMTLWISNWNNLKNEFVRKEKEGTKSKILKLRNHFKNTQNLAGDFSFTLIKIKYLGNSMQLFFHN